MELKKAIEHYRAIEYAKDRLKEAETVLHILYHDALRSMNPNAQEVPKEFYYKIDQALTTQIAEAAISAERE